MRLARRIGGGESASVRARWHRGFIRLKHRTSFSRQPVFSMVGFGRGKMTTTIEEHYRTLIPGLGALLDFLAASHMRAIAFLVAICLVSYLPGFFNIPPVDRDEARFVQATKQMIESGDYVDIRFQEEERYKKPVGIYWLQEAAVRAAEGLGSSDPRPTIWLYRLPSLIGAIGAVLLTYWTALAFGTRRTAYLSALMLACSLLLGVEARLAKTDAMLLLAVVAAFGALARAYLAAPEAPMDRRTWLIPAMFWTALAGGVLLKGPVILILVALAVGAARRGRRVSRVATPSRAGDAIPAGLAGAGVAPVRTGAHQAAALRAAALPRHRHPHCANDGARRSFARPAPGARQYLMAGGDRNAADRRRDRGRRPAAAARAAGVAVFRRGDDLRISGLAVLRDRRRGALAAARRRRRDHAVGRGARRDRAAAASAVSERVARLQCSSRLRAAAVCVGRLSRAEPGVPVRHFDTPHRWPGGGRLSA